MLGSTPTVIEVTLSLDTAIHADGDVLAATQEIENAVRQLGGKALLVSCILIDKDKQEQPLELVFLKTNVSVGAENAAEALTAANADQVLGRLLIYGGDYLTKANYSEVTRDKLSIVLAAAATSKSVFIAAESGGTGTYTASGIVLQLGLIQY